MDVVCYGKSQSKMDGLGIFRGTLISGDLHVVILGIAAFLQQTCQPHGGICHYRQALQITSLQLPSGHQTWLVFFANPPALVQSSKFFHKPSFLRNVLICFQTISHGFFVCFPT